MSDNNEIKIWITPYAYAKLMYIAQYCNPGTKLYTKQYSCKSAYIIEDISITEINDQVICQIFIVKDDKDLSLVKDNNLVIPSKDLNILLTFNPLTNKHVGQAYFNLYGLVHTTSIVLEVNWTKPFLGSAHDDWQKFVNDISIDTQSILSPKPLGNNQLSEEDEKEAEEWFENMLHPRTIPISSNTGNSYWDENDYDAIYTTHPITTSNITPSSSFEEKSPYESKIDYEEVDWQDIDWSIPDDELETYIVCDKTGKVFKKKVEVKAA